MEALLHCQRLDDAMEEAQRLKAGVDGQYLQAECRWRSGDVTGALDMLRVRASLTGWVFSMQPLLPLTGTEGGCGGVRQAALGTNPSSSKCTRLKCFLEGVLVLLEEVQLMEREGSLPEDCIGKLGEMLGKCEDCSCRHHPFHPPPFTCSSQLALQHWLPQRLLTADVSLAQASIANMPVHVL